MLSWVNQTLTERTPARKSLNLLISLGSPCGASRVTSVVKNTEEILSLSTSNESAVRPAWLRLSLTKVFSITCPLQIFQIHAPTCIWLTTLFEDFSFHFSTRSWRSIIFFNDLFSAITRFDRFEPRLSICGGQSQRAPSSRNCLFLLNS